MTRLATLIAVAALAVSAAGCGDTVKGHATLAPGTAERLDQIAHGHHPAAYTQTGAAVLRVSRAVGDALGR